MKIRLLDAADRAAFRGLRLAALGSDPDSFMMTMAEERLVPRLMVERYLDEPTGGSFFLGAFDQGALCGMVGAVAGNHAKRRHVTEILSLYVQPQWRGQGLGRQLLRAALNRIFAETTIDRVKLSVVAGNQTALSLYASFGFVEHGREPAAYALGEKSWDLIEMSLQRPTVMLA